MSRYLTCCLYAPIGSMGGMVSGALRTGWDRPARSAIVGMVAAALGIPRIDEPGVQGLEAGLKVAMLVERPGTVWNDFHTTQASSGKSTWTTRAGEIAAIKPSDNPVVSRREYRSDIVVFVALWLTEMADTTLEAIHDALRKPGFTLFMGRKSCPFGLPVTPEIADANTPVEALLRRYQHGKEREVLNEIRGRKPSPYIALDQSDVGGETAVALEHRSDRLLSRQRWQFLPRGEVIIPVTVKLPEPAGESRVS